MKSFHQKTQITEQHGVTECEYCVYLTFSFSLFTSTDRRWCLFPIQKITKAIFATPTKQFLLADEEFSSKKTNNWAAWNYRMWVLRLSHVFIFIIHLKRQEVMFVSDSKDNKSYLRDTNETIFASRWRVFIKKKPNNWAAWNYRTWVLRFLTFSFSLFTSFNRQEVMFVCDSKNSFCYLRDTNETIFASRWRVFFKNPHNSAAWNYRTWVLRLSHVCIFIIHLIQQTGSDVCFRFKR